MTPLLRGKRAPSSTVVAILGMHRSGTSWLTGALQQLGLNLGDVNTQSKGNAKGNRESRFLMGLHESVLRSNGGSWRRPNYPNTWTNKQRRDLRKHIASMSRDHEVWGFKDPRTLLLIDEWRSQVSKLVRIGIFRHPRSVFTSLKARHDDFTEEEAFALWRVYNERLLAEFDAEPFPIVRFDVEPDILHDELRVVASSIGLTAGAETDFFEDRLVHNAEGADDLPSGLAVVWNALNSANKASVAR